jgi:sugar lactone lactonase YvrE
MTRRRCLPLLFSALLSGCGAAAGGASPSGIPPAAAGGSPASAYKIYVANVGDDTITTYKPDGSETTPTIHTGDSPTDYLYAVAVAPNGKIYALNFDGLLGPGTSGTVTSFKPDGTQTSPTIAIKETGYRGPTGIAVDAKGKIYVLSSEHNGSAGTVTTYRPDGSQTTPTFSTGPDSNGITIDDTGKIYVTNDVGVRHYDSVTTYLPNGTPTKPTITRRLAQPIGVAIAADGTIYVANYTDRNPDGPGGGYVTAYGAAGGGPLLRIRNGAGGPGGIVIHGTNIYVASSTPYSSILKTYMLGGKKIEPTITAGLDEPSGIAVH